jgi:cytoskeletal protein CcmA (bactofilin family)
MNIWREQSSAKKDLNGGSQTSTAVLDEELTTPPLIREPSRMVKDRQATESLIAADLTIEGKIEGSGDVRLVGKFKGDVHVDGNLTIEEGAKLTGSVRAGTVVISGELEGNIDSASSVELLKTAVLNGDLKAGSLTVAAGSRMRGQADFGWDEGERRQTKLKVGSTAAV